MTTPQRPWSGIEAEYVSRMRERYGNLDCRRSEEMTRRLAEMKRVHEDPFDGLADNTHGAELP